mmetsp:Transcript_250/g.434  ORF Transcript_250/g.434 Transcript_250/m.434 type:complete len:327 (-) Transcript_250:170-1150(-)
MRLPQLRHNLNGLQPRILGQRVRNHLQRIRIRLETMRVHARRLQRQLAQTQRSLRLGSTATGNQKPLLHQRTNDALRIVNGSIGLGQNQLVRSAKQHRRRLSGIGHAHEFDNLVSRSGKDDVSHVLGASQLFGREGIDVGHGRASQGATDEFDIGSFDVGNNENSHLGQEVQTQFVVCIAEDALLDEDDVCSALFDLFAHVEDVLALVAKYAIHGGVVADDDVVVHVRFGSREAELNQCNLGILNLTGPPRRLGGSLIKDKARHQLGIIHSPTQLFHHPDISQIDINSVTRIGSQYAQHGIHRQGSQEIAILRHHLGRKTGLHSMN